MGCVWCMNGMLTAKEMPPGTYGNGNSSLVCYKGSLR